MCHLRTQNPSEFMHFLPIFSIPVNFVPFALVDPGPADSSAGFGAGASAAAQPGERGAAGEAADLVTFPEVGDFDVRYVHGYGKVPNVEAGMVFPEDRSGILRWKIFWGISVRPLGAKTGFGREAGGPPVTLFCPFWVKHKKRQEEKVFLVSFSYIRPPSSHTWALLCTQDELGQLRKVRGVPLTEIGGVLPGTREVGGAAQTAALTTRAEAFWLRWDNEAHSDMSRKVEAEARKLAHGEDVASESSGRNKSSLVRGKQSRGRPPKASGKVPGVTPAGQASELLRLQSGNELLKGKVALLGDQVAERDAQLVAVGRERQRADELLKERDSQLLAERSTASKAESGWRTRKKKLLEEQEAARGQRGTKRTAREPMPVQHARAAEDMAWLTQCAVELRTGPQQAASATVLLEDSLKRADKEAAPPPSSAEALDALLKKCKVGDILHPPRKKGATEPLTPTGASWCQGSGAR